VVGTSIRIFRILAFAGFLAGCTSVSGTGRSQFNAYSVSEEISLGEQAYGELTSNASIIHTGSDARMVQAVAARIAAAADRMFPEIAPRFDWDIVFIDDPDVANAWALPGGKMAVYSGLLPITKNAAGLAVVLGHEAAHAIARHGGENMTRAGIVNALAIGTSIALDGEHDDSIGTVMMAYGLLGEPAFSRNQESEADEIGLFITAEAGYNPRAAIGLWERMAARGGGPPEFLSTHPSERTRIRRLEALMPAASKLYRAAKKQ
jgi:predicted Zn-dependent protease